MNAFETQTLLAMMHGVGRSMCVHGRWDSWVPMCAGWGLRVVGLRL